MLPHRWLQVHHFHNIDFHNIYFHNIDHNNYYSIIFNIVIVDHIVNIDDYHYYIYITDNDNRDHHHCIYNINIIHYFYVRRPESLTSYWQASRSSTRDVINVGISFDLIANKQKPTSATRYCYNNSTESIRETTGEGREHLQSGHPKQGCNNINISKNIKNSIASDNKIEIEKHIKQRMASNIIKINILEVNSINKDGKEEGINIGVPDQSIKHIEMDIIVIISLLNKLHNIRREQKTEKYIIDIREIEYNIKIYKINIKVYEISIMIYRINIRTQDNESMIIIEDSSHNYRLDHLEAAFYHDGILGLESLLVINDHNWIIIDHNALQSFTNIKRTLKTNIYLEFSIYIKHCNL